MTATEERKRMSNPSLVRDVHFRQADSCSTRLVEVFEVNVCFIGRGSAILTRIVFIALDELHCFSATDVLPRGSNVPFGRKNRSGEEFLNMGDGKWVKGVSGNPAGRKRKRLFDDYLREALAAKRGEAARRLVERLVGEAAMGNVQALKLICERIGGKPRTAEDAAISNGDELTLEQVRAKLAELLSRPEVRRNLEALTAESKPKTDVVQ